MGGAVLVAVGLAFASLPALAQVATPAAITLRPECGEPLSEPGQRYAITVTGRNFNPVTSVLVTFDSARGGRPESFQTRTDGFGRFSLEISPLRRPAGAYQVRADDLRQREAVAVFPVPCLPTTVTTATVPDTTPDTVPTTVPDTVVTTTPTTSPPPVVEPPQMVLDPPIGPPGFVTIAVGSRFPANAPVTLTWSPGITGEPLVPVVADATGAFRAQVLVFWRDQLGPRRLTATPAGAVPFPGTTAPFLVVPGKLQPGDFRDRR